MPTTKQLVAGGAILVAAGVGAAVLKRVMQNSSRVPSPEEAPVEASPPPAPAAPVEGSAPAPKADRKFERTYIMIKPDGVQRGLVGKIIKRFETKGYFLSGLKQ